MSSKSDLALSIQGLSKSYIITHGGLKRPTFREVCMDRLRHPFARPQTESFWALNDVSFDVKKGEVVGIIGRNGAGKSTLLKILSRITEPTTGQIDVYGRIGSLLEVGTGFHPELTGRENIYLNGAILGMRRAEIARQFDAIVDFAGVEKFLDTPVKRYSSGMYVRLAFAVAAHLRSEILIVDEVLAVGDAEFQKKCIGKMKDVSSDGKTVLFVSHNMVATRSLCDRAILLRKGVVASAGATEEVVSGYLAGAIEPTGHVGRGDWCRRHEGRSLAVEDVELTVAGRRSTTVRSGDRVQFRVHYRAKTPLEAAPSISLLLYHEGQKVANLWTEFNRASDGKSDGSGNACCTIERWPLRSGKVHVDVFTHTGLETQDWFERVLDFESQDGDFYGAGVITNPDQGIMFVDHSWSYHAPQ